MENVFDGQSKEVALQEKNDTQVKIELILSHGMSEHELKRRLSIYQKTLDRLRDGSIEADERIQQELDIIYRETMGKSEQVSQEIQKTLYASGIKQVTESSRQFFYSPVELSEYYGVHVSTVYAWIHAELFPVLHQGGRYYISMHTVEWIDSQAKKLVYDNDVHIRKLFPRLVHTAVQIGSLAFPREGE